MLEQLGPSDKDIFPPELSSLCLYRFVKKESGLLPYMHLPIIVKLTNQGLEVTDLSHDWLKLGKKELSFL